MIIYFMMSEVHRLGHLLYEVTFRGTIVAS